MRKIAHRSGPVSYPEQTVDAAKEALILGADIIEIDLRFSKDNEIIICHDDNTERVFGINRNTYDLTADEFVSLQHKCNPDYHGHIFSDYINSGIKPLLLHIKEGGDKIFSIVNFLENNNYLENVIFGVSKTDDIINLKNISKDIPVLAFIKNPDYIEESISAGADFIRLWQGNVTEERIKYIKSSGKEVWIMAGNYDGYETGYTSVKFLEFLKKQKVDGILMNNVNDLNVVF